MINYSAIPEANKIQSPSDSLKLSLIITFSILTLVGMGALANLRGTHGNAIMLTIATTLCIGFIIVLISVIFKGYRGFSKQNQWMEAFARDNNWKYDASKRSIDNLRSFPSSLGISPNASKVRCTVSGELNDISFELSHVTYVQSRGLLGKLVNAQKYRFAWVSVISLNGQPPIYKNPKLIYDKDEAYTYIICPLNAYFADDIRSMFSSFVDSK